MPIFLRRQKKKAPAARPRRSTTTTTPITAPEGPLETAEEATAVVEGEAEAFACFSETGADADDWLDLDEWITVDEGDGVGVGVGIGVVLEEDAAGGLFVLITVLVGTNEVVALAGVTVVGAGAEVVRGSGVALVGEGAALVALAASLD